MFGRANRRLRKEREENKRASEEYFERHKKQVKSFVKKLKKLKGKDIVVEWRDSVDGLKGKSTCLLWKISDNDKCVILRKGDTSYVETIEWVKDHFVDSFSK